MGNDVLHFGTGGGFDFYLTRDGKFFIRRAGTSYSNTPYLEKPWYEDAQHRPWLVRNHKNFRSLVMQGVREGDYDDIPKHVPYNKEVGANQGGGG